jgi:hypothetical protein
MYFSFGLVEAINGVGLFIAGSESSSNKHIAYSLPLSFVQS